jgi:putative transposase
VTESYAAIEQLTHNPDLSLTQACALMRVSRAGYYEWLQQEPSIKEMSDALLEPRINEIFWQHRRRYGARRIASVLQDEGLVISPKRVAKLMKNQGLHALQPKSFQPKTTVSRHKLGYSPNLLLELPPLTKLNQLWVGDITYIPLRDGRFCYLAMLMDRCSRTIVGWSLGEKMQEALVTQALQQAIRKRQPDTGLIHHTDRGGQYAGHCYRDILRRAQMQQSMSRADNCYDNAFMESCLGTFKNELQMTDYQHQGEADRVFAEYIDYYNQERKHSALEYLTPAQFERQFIPRK